MARSSAASPSGAGTASPFRCASWPARPRTPAFALFVAGFVATAGSCCAAPAALCAVALLGAALDRRASENLLARLCVATGNAGRESDAPGADAAHCAGRAVGRSVTFPSTLATSGSGKGLLWCAGADSRAVRAVSAQLALSPPAGAAVDGVGAAEVPGARGVPLPARAGFY